ncbi:MAG TPA: hypothetical protein VFQ61_36600 [Polyangiaceae bacterium]|nr:hypothetical protein [Polyangiaceae bacterium]
MILLNRRTWLAASLGLGLELQVEAALGLGRRPFGGTLRLSLPWGVTRLDPHELDDPLGALFAGAVFDPIFSLDARGRAYATLAQGLPEPGARGGCRVRLRGGLETAAGKPLLAADLKTSLERAAKRAARALVAPLGETRLNRADPLVLEFPGAASPQHVERALANPACALVPRDFTPLAPDGSGAFAARLERGRLRLERNLNAARGPAFLDAIEITTASSLAEALRDFEASKVDVGWLGSGLHQPRPGAVPFRAGRYGWVILRTGKLARAWGAPGVAQLLLDGIPAERLSHLGLDNLPRQPSEVRAWAGGPAELLVVPEAPQLALVAHSLASLLSQPGHELKVTELAPTELARRRSAGDYALIVDFVRSVGMGPALTQLALLTAENPALAVKPPHVDHDDARSMARQLRFGVVGELAISGSYMPAFKGLSEWQLADVVRAAE